MIFFEIKSNLLLSIPQNYTEKSKGKFRYYFKKKSLNDENKLFFTFHIISKFGKEKAHNLEPFFGNSFCSSCI
jgi:hypothetical protein